MSDESRPRLIVFAGLPGAGKSTLARKVAIELRAVYLRIDSIEQSLRDAGKPARTLYDEGYRVAYAMAEDNLRLGFHVVSDSVNPVAESRDAWIDVARRTNVPVFEIEVICSDARTHRERVESRTSDIPGLQLPTWEAVLSRHYEPWARNRTIIDTAGRSVDDCLRELLASLP
jgi:predicted kinase